MAAATLSFPAIDARAQSPAADDLFVVVLATTASEDPQLSARLPEGFRDKFLYWRQVKSGGAGSYQLALGFFAFTDAEPARQRLAASFPDARVFLIDAAERENVRKAQQSAAPVTLAPPAQAISLAPPAAAAPAAIPPASPPAAEPQSVRPLPPPPGEARGFRPDLRIKTGGAPGIKELEFGISGTGALGTAQDGGDSLQIELVSTARSQSGVGFVGAVGLFRRGHSGKGSSPTFPGATTIDYSARGVAGSLGIGIKANEYLHFEGRVELDIGDGKPKLTTPGLTWNNVRSGVYTSAALIVGGYYTITTPGVQIGIELGTQSFAGDFEIWNNGGFWTDGRVRGSGTIASFTLGYRF